MNKVLNKKIRIDWNDAVIYSINNIPSKLAGTVTIGFCVEENKDFVIIKDSKTFSKNNNLKKRFLRIVHFFLNKKKPIYFFIPKGMIEKITEI